MNTEGKTESTAEAMGVLNRAYGPLIEKGREVARDIAREKGTVTSRDMVLRMESMGLIPEGPRFWVGAVFNKKFFKFTGKRVSYGFFPYATYTIVG